MTIHRHDIIKYTLSTAAFLAALAVAGGCALTGSPSASSSPAPQPALLPEPPADAAVSPQPVNAYGEFASAAARTTAATPGTSGAFQQHTFAADGRDAEVAIDPTGKLLAYASTRHSEHPDIYLQKTDGVSVVQLTDDPADDAFPSFSPDGQKIAFCSTRNGSWDIYTMDTDGSHVVQVTSGPSQDLHPSFSPDGTRLAYCSMGSRSDNWELWVVELSTGAKRMIGYGLFPVWSPDKSADRIAFQRASQRGSRLFSLWTLDLVDGEARRITEVASAPDAAIVSPSWSPDGQRLAYTVIHPGTGGVGAAAAVDDKEIWTINADGTARQRLTGGDGVNFSPAWAVDNRIYFVSNRSGNDSIWSVRAGADRLPAAAPTARAQPKPVPAALPPGSISITPSTPAPSPAAQPPVAATDTHEIASH